MSDGVGEPVTGTILAGRYRVESKLGAGGMGVVLKATQIDLDRLVAIKLLLPEFQKNPQVIERFFREAKAAARIQSDHVARILDVGKLDSGAPYIAMEFLEGEDLGRLLEREGRLSVAVATTYMLHACTAVAEAHAARIVHRDLKPQNLFLATTHEGKSVLKVLDFGISRLDESASHLTETSSALGTAFYMAPEQITSPKTIDVRADIWALGVVYYELLTGKTPFDGETLPQVVAHVIKNERVHARDVIPDIPDAVDAIIDKCLAAEPAGRFQTAVDLAAALASIGQNEDDEMMVAHLRSLPPPPPSTTETSTFVSQGSARGPSAHELAATQVPAIPDLVLEPKKPGTSQSLQRANPAGPGAPMSDARPASSKQREDIVLDPQHSGMPKIEIDRAPIDYQRRATPRTARSAYARELTYATDDDDEPRRSPWRKLLVALALLGALPLACYFIAPRVLGARVDAAAARAGILLTHDVPTLSLSGIDIKNLNVTFEKSKDTGFHAGSAHIAFAGDGIALNDVQAKSSAPPDALMRVLGDSDAQIPWSVDILGLSFDYTPQEGTSLSCAGKFSAHAALSSRNLWLECSEAHVKTRRGDVGPFTISIDRTRGLWNASLAIPDAASAGVVPTASLVTNDHGLQVNAEIAHASLEKMHIPPALLGLKEDDRFATIDLKIEARSADTGVTDGTGSIAVHDALLGATRMDASWDFAITAGEGGILAVNKTAKIAVFPAQINAAWKQTAPLAVALTFRTSAFSCADLARARGRRGPKAPGVAPAFPSLTGAANETGDLRVAGSILWDALANEAQVKLDTNDTCGLLIFPRKL